MPADVRAEVIAGLSRTRKTLPCKLFYDQRGSELFERICEQPEYYQTRTELRITRDHADEMPTLLRRAAEHEPDLARTVAWLARAGAWEQAAQALTQRGPAMVMVGGGPTIERLLAQFPPVELESRPALHHLRALYAYQQFDFETMGP